MTLKIQGQGHGENRPKSNQVIYRLGPSMPPKMKEIWKVIQKLLCEQDSVAGADAKNRYKNIKSSPVYRAHLTKVRVQKPKKPIWLPGGHVENYIAENK